MPSTKVMPARSTGANTSFLPAIFRCLERTNGVSISTSLTGSVSSYGIAGQNGMQMAIDDINAKTGVNGYKIELDSADDAATASKGADNAKRLIVEDSVVALFGAVLTLLYYASLVFGNRRND